MEGRLTGKVAIVTGAGQGIGRAVALSFAREGAFVVAATRTAEHGEACLGLIAAAGGRGALRTVDVGDAAAARDLVDAVAAEHRGLDILVHNAAAFARQPVEALDEAALDHLLAVNVKACFTLTAAAVPHMRARGGGRILVTSSVTGPRVTMPGAGYYAATKGAVNAFIRTAALELAADRITVNGVEPGFIDTPGLGNMKRRFGEEAMARFIPAKRLGRPEEVASAMLFLAGEDAAYVTGQTLVVDGGSTLPETPLYML